MADLETKVAVLETNLSNLTESNSSHSDALSRVEESVLAIRSRVDQWNGAIPRIATAVEKIEERDRKLTEIFTAHATRLSSLDQLPAQVNELREFRASAKLIFGALGSVSLILIGLVLRLLVGG